MTSVSRYHTEFVRDGVTVVRGALDPGDMQLAEQAYRWSIEHPGPNANRVLDGQPGSFYQDHANPSSWPAYRPLLCDTGLTHLVADLMGSCSLWFLYEQIWLKHGGETRCTPWHQDLPYVPMAGDHLATVWLNLDPVPRERSLEFVLCSHCGPLYNPTAFDSVDSAAAMFAPGIWPSLPDIEAQRAHWPIISWDITPGDLVVFHPAILHGGAPTHTNEQRRTISLRFFGDDACCAPRPEAGLCEVDKLTVEAARNDPMVAMARKPPGAQFRHPSFVRLR